MKKKIKNTHITVEKSSPEKLKTVTVETVSNGIFSFKALIFSKEKLLKAENKRNFN